MRAGYSDQYDTICTGLAWPGYIAGTGLLGGVNPEEMAQSDVIVIWGTNAVNTQVNVMTHAMRARKGARGEDRGHRHLPQRHAGAGRPAGAAAAGLGRRAGAGGDERHLARRAGRPGTIFRASPISRLRSRRIC
jgi:hypothetical protein